MTTSNPDPSGWGQPWAIFSGDCDFDSHLVDQKIANYLLTIPNIAADDLPSRPPIRHFVVTGQVMYGTSLLILLGSTRHPARRLPHLRAQSRPRLPFPPPFTSPYPTSFSAT